MRKGLLPKNKNIIFSKALGNVLIESKKNIFYLYIVDFML